MKWVFLSMIISAILGIVLSKGVLTKDYVFVVSNGHVYKCNERTGKIGVLTMESGLIIYGHHD
jgi:hypothetical protein